MLNRLVMLQISLLTYNLLFFILATDSYNGSFSLQETTALPEPVKAPPEKGEGAETYYRSKKQRAEDVRRKKRAAELERKIAGDEAEIERLTAYMSGEEAASDYEKLTEAANRIEELSQGLGAKYEEWYALSE